MRVRGSQASLAAGRLWPVGVGTKRQILTPDSLSTVTRIVRRALVSGRLKSLSVGFWEDSAMTPTRRPAPCRTSD
jgi:hypothetical protein